MITPDQTLKKVVDELEQCYCGIGDRFARIEERSIFPSFFRSLSDILEEGDLSKLTDQDLEFIQNQTAKMAFCVMSINFLAKAEGEKRATPRTH